MSEKQSRIWVALRIDRTFSSRSLVFAAMMSSFTGLPPILARDRQYSSSARRATAPHAAVRRRAG